MNMMQLQVRALTLRFGLLIGSRTTAVFSGFLLALSALLTAGCVAPVGADRVTARQSYEQVNANALSSGKPSAGTVSVLHRYDLDLLAVRHPDEAVRQLHQRALSTGDRDILFALAETSFVAGERIRDNMNSCDLRDCRDYYLGSAVYAWLFLFGEGKDPQPQAFERRFREACDFYEYGLGLALTKPGSRTAAVQLENGWRRLPVGGIELRISRTNFASRLPEFDRILLADLFRVRGLSVRNRWGGVGAPLICVWLVDPVLGLRRSTPATALLRAPYSLAEIDSGKCSCSLDVYSTLDTDIVKINGNPTPLETDLTTYRAYILNQSFVWDVGILQFLAPSKQVRSQLVRSQPYVPGRIPVVFVHGTFSSPATWAEMVNSLIADPELRHRYQLWSYFYSTGNPLYISVREFREALTAMVKELDPEGKDPALRQMVIIGHSQGGLLTHCTAIDTGDQLWRVLSTNRLESLEISDVQRAELRETLFLKPLPFVSRVVFISTPHRGSSLAGSLVRRWARRLTTLPSHVISHGEKALKHVKIAGVEKFFRGRVPTSLDSMSPKNPFLNALADIPVVHGVKANSIISVKGEGDYRKGGDGVVTYQSAHVDYVESEQVVRGPHTCLDLPATTAEARRILHEHLNQLPAGTLKGD